MQTGTVCSGTVTGEARVRVEGGLAHFPGRATDRIVSFDQLAMPERQEIAHLAEEAHFFDCSPAQAPTRPDARTYMVGLTIGARSRDIRLAEPIGDPALARLVSVVRRLARQHGMAR